LGVLEFGGEVGDGGGEEILDELGAGEGEGKVVV